MSPAAAVLVAAILTVESPAVGSTMNIEAARREYKEAEAVGAMAEVWDLEDGGLVEGATIEKLEEAEQLAEDLHDCEHKENLEVMADAARDELASKWVLYGTCRITGYCNCSACCGIWAGGGTASGTTPTAWRTVANGSLPFGTHVLIDGVEYIVEDRGVPGDAFDIYFNTHAEASACGLHYTEVYVLG